MFDLFRSRAKAVRIVLGGILMLVAAAMVITLIPGFGGADFGASAQTLGEVAGEPITVAELQENVQQLSRQGMLMNDDQKAAMYPVAFQNLVQERALLYEAKRLGFDVSDQELATMIRQMPVFSPGGQFIGMDQYRMMLEQNGMNPTQFEANVRKQLITNRLSAIVARTVVVSPDEVDAALRERNEKVAVEYAYLVQSDLLAQVNPTDEEIRAFYAKVENRVRLLEKRDIDIVRISLEKAMESFRISPEEIKAFYEANMDQWRVDEQLELQHILLKTEGKSEAEKAAAKKKAEGLLAQLKAGADFVKLAAANSEDDMNAQRGGDLGIVTRGQTVPAFEAAAFALKPGEISNVVETEYGFHIIRCKEHRQAHVKSVEEVRDQIASILAQQKATEVVQQAADRLRGQVAADPAKAAEIVAKEPLAQLSSFEGISPNTPAGNIPGNTPLMQAVSSAAEGQVTNVEDVGAGALAFAIVRKYHPARDATFEEARGRLVSTLKNQGAMLLAERKLTEAKEAVDAGTPLKTVAANSGLTYGQAPPFSRLAAAEGIGNVGEIYKAFDVKVGDTIPPFRSANRMYLVRVTEKIPANMAELAGQREETRKQLSAVKSQQRVQLYVSGIRDRLEKDGAIKIDTKRLTALIQAASSRSR